MASMGKAPIITDSKVSNSSTYLERRESREVAVCSQVHLCHDCRYERAFHFAENCLVWQLGNYCGKGAKYGRRCKLYQKRGVGNGIQQPAT
jgi:hypothetical protein